MGDSEQPIYFNKIILTMKEQMHGTRVNQPDPFRMGIEEFQEEGQWWWRVYARDGSRLVASSGRKHPLPGDALRELTEIMDAKGRS